METEMSQQRAAIAALREHHTQLLAKKAVAAEDSRQVIEHI